MFSKHKGQCAAHWGRTPVHYKAHTLFIHTIAASGYLLSLIKTCKKIGQIFWENPWKNMVTAQTTAPQLPKDFWKIDFKKCDFHLGTGSFYMIFTIYKVIVLKIFDEPGVFLLLSAEESSWRVLTLSFRPNTTVFPRSCSFLNLHSTKFWPFSPGNVMFLRTTVGLAAPTNKHEWHLQTCAVLVWDKLCRSFIRGDNGCPLSF